VLEDHIAMALADPAGIELTVATGAPQAGGSRRFLTPPGHLLTSFHTVLMMQFCVGLPTLPSF
jgi:hypothetical protein